MSTYRGYRQRSSAMPRLIALTVLVVVLLVAVAYVYSRVSAARGTVSAEDLDRVLLIAAAPNDAGDIVAQIVAVAEVSGSAATLESVSPSLPVSVPGTSYGTLQYAYPFGGGAGVASALAEAEDTAPLPYIVIKADELALLVEAAGGVTADLPADMTVFDGEQLYTFTKGRNTLSAGELMALLKGAPYLPPSDRARLDRALAGALAEALAASPDGLAAEAASGGITTTLDATALSKLEEILAE